MKAEVCMCGACKSFEVCHLVWQEDEEFMLSMGVCSQEDALRRYLTLSSLRKQIQWLFLAFASCRKQEIEQLKDGPLVSEEAAGALRKKNTVAVVL